MKKPKTCPDCAQPLNEYQQPRSIGGLKVWCATCEDSRPKRPSNRPRFDPAVARIKKSYYLHPDTIQKLKAEAARTGESASRVIDRLAETLASQIIERAVDGLFLAE